LIKRYLKGIFCVAKKDSKSEFLWNPSSYWK